MTCKDCKFYENECESHAQMRTIGKERGMEICEIFCPRQSRRKENDDGIRRTEDHGNELQVAV